MSSDLASEIISGINPKIIIEVSATHRSEYNPAVDVKVDEPDVIDSGLIKQQILFQTEEDIKKISQFDNLNQNEKMLELAYQKRLEILKEYKKCGSEINPLIMIQLPNDVDDYEVEGTTLINEVKNFLNKKIKEEYCVNKKYEYAISLEDHLAIWLSDQHENLDIIKNNDSKIDYLIFKQAAATG
jgi:type III restriction enzyme